MTRFLWCVCVRARARVTLGSGVVDVVGSDSLARHSRQLEYAEPRSVLSARGCRTRDIQCSVRRLTATCNTAGTEGGHSQQCPQLQPISGLAAEFLSAEYQLKKIRLAECLFPTTGLIASGRVCQQTVCIKFASSMIIAN